MTVFFDKTLKDLNRRLDLLDSNFERLILLNRPFRISERNSFQEGLMSALWQSWCHFCKEIVLGSIVDGVTTKGISVTSTYSTYNERELVYIASRFIKGASISTIKEAPRYTDLTWGDASKLNSVITSFNPTNHATLLSGLSGVILLRDLQKFRNANSHISSFTIGELKGARTKYSNTKFMHPSDTMFWVDPSTKDYLWKSWVEEIKIVSTLMSE